MVVPTLEIDVVVGTIGAQSVHIDFLFADNQNCYGSLQNYSRQVIYVGIEPLKARHDVTKLDLTIPLPSFWCINIDLSIPLMSLITLYVTQVHQELHRRYKSWVPCKQTSCPQLVHRFGQSNRDCSAPPPNQKDTLSWLPRGVSHGKCTSNVHWIVLMVNHDARLSNVMIQ